MNPVKIEQAISELAVRGQPGAAALGPWSPLEAVHPARSQPHDLTSQPKGVGLAQAL